MKTTRIRLTLAAIALLALTAAGAAATQAAQAATSSSQDRPAPAAPTGAPATPTVEQQSGVVVEASGSAGTTTASVTLYENSRYGSSVQVVLGEDLIGYAESATALVVDGAVEVSVDVDGRPATLRGTLAPQGRAEKVVEPTQDAGEQVVTRGTRTALAGDLTLTHDGITVPLHLDTAFAYDLEVRRVALYGR